MANAAWFNEKLGEFISCRVRLAWPSVLVARAIKDDPNSLPRFTVTGLIPADADMRIIEAEQAKLAEGEFGKTWKSNKKLLLALRSTADDDGLSEYAEGYPLRLSASAYEDKRPLIYRVEAGKMVPFDGDAVDIYSGRWGMLGGTMKSYNKVSKGVKFTLNRLILLNHDDRLSIKGAGPKNSTEGFEGIDLGEGESASSMFD